IATRPESAPLRATLTSGLPTLAHVTAVAASAPPEAPTFVFRAMRPNAFPAPAAGFAPPVTPVVLPALKPNHPIQRMNTPKVASVMECPRIGGASGSYLPRRGPSTIAPARAAQPPTLCTTVDPA